MHFFSSHLIPNIAVGVLIVGCIVIALLTGLAATLRSTVAAMTRVLEMIARPGYWLRSQKERLRPLMRFMPPANVQTLGRGIILNWVNWQLWQGHWAGLLPWFIGGWLTDFTDGLKARYEDDRKRRALGISQQDWVPKKGWGRYLDPLIDIPTSLITAFVLRPAYPHPHLVIAFLVVSGLRLLASGLYGGWAFCSGTDGVVPSNIAGQSKTWFLATSFGLIMLSHQSASVGKWAEMCLGLAVVLEIFGGLSAGKAAMKKLRQCHQVRSS